MKKSVQFSSTFGLESLLQIVRIGSARSQLTYLNREAALSAIAALGTLSERDAWAHRATLTERYTQAPEPQEQRRLA